MPPYKNTKHWYDDDIALPRPANGRPYGPSLEMDKQLIARAEYFFSLGDLSLSASCQIAVAESHEITSQFAQCRFIDKQQDEMHQRSVALRRQQSNASTFKYARKYNNGKPTLHVDGSPLHHALRRASKDDPIYQRIYKRLKREKLRIPPL